MGPCVSISGPWYHDESSEDRVGWSDSETLGFDLETGGYDRGGGDVLEDAQEAVAEVAALGVARLGRRRQRGRDTLSNHSGKKKTQVTREESRFCYVEGKIWALDHILHKVVKRLDMQGPEVRDALLEEVLNGYPAARDPKGPIGKGVREIFRHVFRE